MVKNGSVADVVLSSSVISVRRLVSVVEVCFVAET